MPVHRPMWEHTRRPAIRPVARPPRTPPGHGKPGSGGGNPIDPLAAYVKVLMRGDTTRPDGFGYFEPVDDTGRLWENNEAVIGASYVDTSVKRFGAGSLYVPANGNSYFNTTDKTGMDPGTGAFAWECWFRGNVNCMGFSRAIISDYQNATNGISISLDTNKRLYVNLTGDGIDLQGTTVLSDETWYFVQLLRAADGTTVLGLNGVAEATGNFAGVNLTSTARFAAGRLGGLALMYFLGWIDDIRVTIGAERSLTLPNKAFPRLS